MKTVWVSIFMAGCAVLVVAYQAIQQEMNIRSMGEQIMLNSKDVKTKEDEILKLKATLQKLSSEVVPLDKQRNQMVSKMQELVKGKETSENNLNTCQTQKTEVQQQKSEKASAVEALRASRNAVVQKAQEEIQSLQKQILDRDTKICLHVDKTREQGKKMCADKMAASKT